MQGTLVHQILLLDNQQYVQHVEVKIFVLRNAHPKTFCERIGGPPQVVAVDLITILVEEIS